MKRSGGLRRLKRTITKKTVDYYERRTLNPTLDVIQRAAEALEVSPAQLIGDDTPPLKVSRKAGPTGKVQKVFEKLARLPRRQQERIVDVVSALMSQYEQDRQ
jgi:transcriptional regulator with XRE-family HTH domain